MMSKAGVVVVVDDDDEEDEGSEDEATASVVLVVAFGKRKLPTTSFELNVKLWRVSET